MAYCGASDVIAYASDPDMDETIIGFLLDAASQAVDDACHDVFESRLATYPMESRGANTLWSRYSFQAVTSIVDDDGTEYDVDNFTPQPANGEAYFKLKLKASAQSSVSLPDIVYVTGTFGYAEIPAGVKLATMLTVLDEYSRHDSIGLRGITTPEFSVTYEGSATLTEERNVREQAMNVPARAQRYLNRYRRMEIATL